MPANPKHLTPSSSQQFAKISAGLIGGYIITALLHMCLALWLPNPKAIIITSIYTHFMVWCALLIVPFLFKNGWASWRLYLIISIVLYVIFYFGNQQNPFV